MKNDEKTLKQIDSELTSLVKKYNKLSKQQGGVSFRSIATATLSLDIIIDDVLSEHYPDNTDEMLKLIKDEDIINYDGDNKVIKKFCKHVKNYIKNNTSSNYHLDIKPIGDIYWRGSSLSC